MFSLFWSHVLLSLLLKCVHKKYDLYFTLKTSLKPQENVNNSLNLILLQDENIYWFIYKTPTVGVWITVTIFTLPSDSPSWLWSTGWHHKTPWRVTVSCLLWHIPGETGICCNVRTTNLNPFMKTLIVLRKCGTWDGCTKNMWKISLKK